MKTRTISTLSLSAVCLALLAAPAIAKPGKDKDKGKDKGAGFEQPGKGNPGKGKPDKDDLGILGNPSHKGGPKFDKFDDKDHLELRNFFAPDNRKNLPPGLQKNLERGKPLPPGWEKKLAAGQVLDGNWLGLMTPVPYDYLPNVRRTPGTRMYYHNNRLVRVSEESGLILDVINLLTR